MLYDYKFIIVVSDGKLKKLAADMGRIWVDILSRYTQTFLWLQQYDEGLLKEPEGQFGGKLTTPEDVVASLLVLKEQLKIKKESSDLFVNPSRADNLAGIFGNLDQSAFGEPAYPTIESKAAHLLYFVVKNHPFTDGNKHRGANINFFFSFIGFINNNFINSGLKSGKNFTIFMTYENKTY